MELQRIALEWAVVQPASNGLALFATGLLCALCGGRFARVLTALGIAAVGVVGGFAASRLLGSAAVAAALTAGAVGGVVAFLAPRVGGVAMGSVGWGTVAAYLTSQFGGDGVVLLSAFGVGAVLGGIAMMVSPETTALLLSCTLGSGLMVVGFTALSNAMLPSLGGTFRSMAMRFAAIVPILILALSITTYSYQANQKRGDIVTGGSGKG